MSELEIWPQRPSNNAAAIIMHHAGGKGVGTSGGCHISGGGISLGYDFGHY